MTSPAVETTVVHPSATRRDLRRMRRERRVVAVIAAVVLLALLAVAAVVVVVSEQHHPSPVSGLGAVAVGLTARPA
ncbi:MAG: hypothetical protein ACRDY1_03685 [Acidimicrobiales bacterium]